MNTKLIVGALILFALIGYDHWRSSQSFDQGFNQCTSDTLTSVNLAVAADRKVEKQKQGKVNEAAQKLLDAQLGINSQLNADLDKLRKRANRKQLTDASKSSCEGATGADLSSADAKFLVGEAARADRIRAGLKTCYDYADTVTQSNVMPPD